MHSAIINKNENFYSNYKKKIIQNPVSFSILILCIILFIHGYIYKYNSKYSKNVEDENKMKIKNLNTILALFLLILAVSGNFVSKTVSKPIRDVLEGNIYSKHIIILMIIYFSLHFTEEENKHPIDTLKRSFFIFLYFLMFNKISIPFVIIVFSLLLSLLIVKKYILYYQSNNQDRQCVEFENISKLLWLSNLLYITLSITIVFDFVRQLYINSRLRNFNILFYLFSNED